jgi:uncharacterized membrane protein
MHRWLIILLFAGKYQLPENYFNNVRLAALAAAFRLLTAFGQHITMKQSNWIITVTTNALWRLDQFYSPNCGIHQSKLVQSGLVVTKMARLTHTQRDDKSLAGFCRLITVNGNKLKRIVEPTNYDRLLVFLIYVCTPILPALIFFLEDERERVFIKAHNAQAFIWGIFYVIVSFSISVFACGLPSFFVWLLGVYWGTQAYQGRPVHIPIITGFVQSRGWDVVHD